MDFQMPKAAMPGLFRRTPPAAFPPVLGLLGLGLGWRRGVGEFGLPAGLAEALVGAITLLAVFVVTAYLAKLFRRPGVVLEDLRILPGRAGLAAGVLCLYLIALSLGPVAPGMARVVFGLGIIAHLGLSAAVIYTFATGPAEQRRVNPVWHLTFTGWIVAALAALGLGFDLLATALFWLTLISAVAIWTISLQQAQRETVPAPLRPLLAIHLAPAALLGSVASTLNAGAMAQAFALIAALALLTALVKLRWLLAAGFSPLWGAFTFPLAATANFWLALGGIWRIPGALLLVAATIAIALIAFRILKLWANGELAMKTNAAMA